MRLLPLLTAGLLLGPAACGAQSEPGEESAMNITVTSTAFQDGAAIPKKYTCDGSNVSPPLAWQGIPAEAKAVALVVDDPDAPRGTFTHWVVLDLDPATTELAEDQSAVKQAKNSAGKASYFGPCPPSGTHHYRFTVYALSAKTGLNDGAKLDDALKAIDDKTITRGRLTGLYSR